MPGDLEFVWYDPRKDAAVGESWGQLAGALHRLAVIAEYLEELPGRQRTEVALEQLAYHLEGYFARTYELRERAVVLVAAILGRKDVGKVKSKKARAEVKASVPAEQRVTLAPLFALVEYRWRRKVAKQAYARPVLEPGARDSDQYTSSRTARRTLGERIRPARRVEEN